MRHMLLFLLFLIALALPAAEVSEESILREYKSDDAGYANADAVLNRVRYATVDIKRAKGYVRELETIIQRYPDYEFKAEAYYFLGLNRKFARDYTGAIDAFSHALNLNPDLAKRAPIQAFIKMSRFEHRAVVVPRIAWAALIAVVVLGIVLAVKGRAWKHVSRRALVILAGSIALWLLTFLVLSAIDTSGQVTGLESYPKPVLVNTTMGDIGDAPVKGILGFGTAAIIVSVLFAMATVQVQPAAKRHAVNIAASLVASTALMALCYMQFCYRTATHIPGVAGGRMNILIKDIVWRDEIPDEMLDLYDGEFRNELMKGREKK